MELKFEELILNSGVGQGYNCTFMELKYNICHFLHGTNGCVIIVPLWN